MIQFNDILTNNNKIIKMKKLEKTFKNSSFGQTPTFHKKDSYMQESVADPDCNFSDDMIDQFNGIPIMPKVTSPTNQSKHHESVSQILKSIENIQNSFTYNNHYEKQQQKNAKNKIIKLYQKQPLKSENIFETSHIRSQVLSKCQSHKFQQNIHEHQLKKQKKIRDLKEQLENKEMQQCTFIPNCHLKDKKTSKRNLQQFLKNQYQHVNKIEKKRQDLKRKAQQSMKLQQSFRPKINKSPNIVPQRQKNKKPAHQRLYVLKDKQFKNVIKQQENSMKVVKKTPSQNYLCGNKSTLIQTKSSKKNFLPSCAYLSKSTERNKVQVENIQKPKNKNNQKYGAQKFIKQFCFVLQSINLLPKLSSYNSLQDSQNINLNTLLEQKNQKGDQLSSREFTHEQFNSILRNLGFLLYDENSQVQLAYKERNLAFQGFQMLQQYGVNIRNVCIFLLSLLGIFNINPVNFYDNDEKQVKTDQFQLDQKQGRRMQKYFDLLYRNRLISNSSHSKRSLTPAGNKKGSSSHLSNYISPKHQQHTKQLASKYRTKMIERANQRFITNNIDIVLPKEQMLTHQDLLVIDNLGRNLQIKKLREDKETHLDQQCTFHPKVNSKGNQNICFTDRGVQKSKNLYEHAKSKQQLLKHGSSVNQNFSNHETQSRNTFKTEYGKSNTSKNRLIKQQLQRKKNNFNTKKNLQSPKLSDFSQTQNIKENQLRLKNKNKELERKAVLNNKIVYPKDVDKTVARMTLGRKQRQLKNKLLQRGEPNYSHKKSPSKSPYKSSKKLIQNQSICPQTINQIHNASTNTFNQPVTYRDINQFNEQGNDAQNQPFLVIDVNMGEQTKQIQFFTGDEKKVGSIVDQFCMDHDLDDECKQQLLEMVSVQMTRYLNNFNVDSTQD